MKPQPSKIGNLPHFSYIKRKPKSLGSELKTIACDLLGIMLYLEIQRRKVCFYYHIIIIIIVFVPTFSYNILSPIFFSTYIEFNQDGMKDSRYQKKFGATTACTL